MAGFPKIPGCKILKELGEGGMSVVYLGIQESLNREVAIKILDPKLLKNGVFAKRFRREAKAAAHLSHSNIIQIIDVGKSHTHHYIIMEYLEESLKDRMKANPGGKIGPQTALEVVQAIMGALEFAHARNIFHRDIKPDNILFRADNTPVLTDFGVARVFGLTDVGELTKSGQSMGTVYYMSPEQCQAREDVDGRSDIYSLGAVLFEMLSGKRPYEGDNMVSVALKHVQEKIPKLPKDLRGYQPLINKMMAKDRRKRISNEAQFQQILDKITTGTVKHTRQTKEFKAIPTGKTPIILILKKIGGAFKKYPVKKKLALGILPVALLVVIFINIFSPGPGSIKNQEVSVTYTTIYRLFREDMPYHIGLSIAGGLYKKGDLESLKEAQVLVNKLKKIKISTEINELAEKIADRIESGEKFNKYLADAQDFFKKKNFSKALENISLAKKIKTTPGLVTLEEEVKKAEEEKRIELEQKDDEAYKVASSRNTIAAYQKYLDKYPSGRHKQEAAGKLNRLKEVERKKQRVTLRSQYKDDLNEEDVKPMLKKYGFFHANWNNTGSFKSYYEKESKKSRNVVIDYTTGLMWYNHELEQEMGIYEAENWVEKLNSEKYGGYDDWRLPTLEEAASLLIKNKNKQGLYIGPIFSSITSKIWTKDSATKKLLARNKYWVVCFDTGTLEESTSYNKHHVRPVRLFK
jgi:serine/threonine protein kinase